MARKKDLRKLKRRKNAAYVAQVEKRRKEWAATRKYLESKGVCMV